MISAKLRFSPIHRRDQRRICIECCGSTGALGLVAFGPLAFMYRSRMHRRAIKCKLTCAIHQGEIDLFCDTLLQNLAVVTTSARDQVRVYARMTAFFRDSCSPHSGSLETVSYSGCSSSSNGSICPLAANLPAMKSVNPGRCAGGDPLAEPSDHIGGDVLGRVHLAGILRRLDVSAGLRVA